ncbi:PAS domain-containing sensor histidine kinase [Ancylomarina sp. 16SWW S1-10-2]|uniref:PAS domain-containing sensor histidine kinase n=1 Tax=Ancylomarina sp. 16SWW S1-10-2 TaxID=2499681 RepID=UPI0012AD3210|nr:PAS domain-containing sensor histidine kinase [Ancylomarina sp. 16SWW S1-10-2]MRT93831.1 PAS domain-containing sensor histidine kinase [Ancylomarina sp. 16SWW S1-10-2]
MKLETNLTDKEKILELEEEISQLKKKLEVSKVVSLSQRKTSNSKNFTNLWGVVDSHYNVLSIHDQWNNDLIESHEKFHGKKCHAAFYGLDEPCKGCAISDQPPHKDVKYFVEPQLDGQDGSRRQSMIMPTSHIQPNELDIKESELFYEQLFESTGDALLVLDSKGRILKFTRKLSKMLSYSEEEFSKLTIFDIDDPTNSLPFEDRLFRIKRDKGAVFETDLISKSGKLIPVESSSSPIRYLNETVFFITFRDIENRKVAQKKLLESEIHFRTLVENATDLVMRIDRDHRHVFVNSATLPVLDIAPEEFIGKTHQEMGFPDALCEFWEVAMDKVFETGISDIFDFSINVRGKEIYFEWQLIPEFNTEDEIQYVLAIARDVSKRIRSEKALEEALKTKDKFFSIIAHDLRNPFGSLKTLSEYIINNDDLSKEEIKEFAGIIHTSATQGNDLLENLLEWSRSQRGNIKWQPEEFDLVSLIDSNIKLIQANIHKKNINVDFKVEKNCFVFADKYMIDTIIRNLLANALKFTYKKGNIDISIQEQEKHFFVSIKDDGKGINKCNQARLFQLDNQYSTVGTEMEMGTGLGLILCKEFVDTNNGTIWVESEEGVGSCFSFTVPKQ